MAVMSYRASSRGHAKVTLIPPSLVLPAPVAVAPPPPRGFRAPASKTLSSAGPPPLDDQARAASLRSGSARRHNRDDNAGRPQARPSPFAVDLARRADNPSSPVLRQSFRPT